MKHRHFFLTIFLLPFLLLLALPSLARAASSDWVTSGETRMRLIAAEPIVGDKIIRAALQVELAPGWKTYWRDPGEAGVPLQIDFSGSKNASLKTVLYPVPKRFDDGVTVWAGYDKPVLFPIELERADAAKGLTITASVFIGICEEICVPFQANLTMSIDNAAASSADQMIVQAAFNALPLAPQDEFKVVSMTIRNKTVVIEAAVKKAQTSADLFLAPSGGWQFAAPQLISLRDGKARFEAAITFSPKNAILDQAEVHYTLVGEDASVSGISEIIE